MEDIARTAPTCNYVKRITDAVVEALHLNSPNFDKHDIYAPINDLCTRNPQQQQQQIVPYKGEYYLRQRVYEMVYWRKLNPKEDVSMFVGPMAAQMSRRDLHMLQEHQYYITEKSDGIRVMMLTIYEKSFPRWLRKIVPAPPEQPYYIPVSLNDTCALEVTYNHLISHHIKSINTSLEMGDYTFAIVDEYDEREKRPIRRTKLITPSNSEDASAPDIIVRRETGWSFNYLFDRKFEFYLCTEEFVFPTIQTQTLKFAIPAIQKVVLLDGELVKNLQKNTFNYTIYDVVTMCISQQQQRQQPGQQQRQQLQFICQPIHMINVPMKDRITAILQNIVEPHHYYMDKFMHKRKTQTFTIVRKHFFKLSELKEVVGRVTTNKDGKHVYSNYNFNDGFVFTPNDPKLYRFQPGSCPSLLKWKWPDKLTVDFMLAPMDDEEENKDPHSCVCSLYYTWKGETIFYKDALVQGFTSPDLKQTERFIAECVFDESSGHWHIDVVRKDRGFANGFKTITSTMETCLENITVKDLEKVCLGKNNDQKQPSSNNNNSNSNNNSAQQALSQLTPEQIDQQIIMHAKKNKFFCIFKVKSQFEREAQQERIILQTCIPAGYLKDRQQDMWFHYCNLSECMGPKGETDQALEKLVRQDLRLQFAHCVYVPGKGKWQIMHLTPSPFIQQQQHQQHGATLYAQDLLKYLEQTIVLRRQILINAQKLSAMLKSRQEELLAGGEGAASDDRYMPSNSAELPRPDSYDYIDLEQYEAKFKTSSSGDNNSGIGTNNKALFKEMQQEEEEDKQRLQQVKKQSAVTGNQVEEHEEDVYMPEQNQHYAPPPHEVIDYGNNRTSPPQATSAPHEVEYDVYYGTTQQQAAPQPPSFNSYDGFGDDDHNPEEDEDDHNHDDDEHRDKRSRNE